MDCDWIKTFSFSQPNFHIDFILFFYDEKRVFTAKNAGESPTYFDNVLSHFITMITHNDKQSNRFSERLIYQEVGSQFWNPTSNSFLTICMTSSLSIPVCHPSSPTPRSTPPKWLPLRNTAPPGLRQGTEWIHFPKAMVPFCFLGKFCVCAVFQIPFTPYKALLYYFPFVFSRKSPRLLSYCVRVIARRARNKSKVCFCCRNNSFFFSSGDSSSHYTSLYISYRLAKSVDSILCLV